MTNNPTQVEPELSEIIHSSMSKDFERKATLQAEPGEGLADEIERRFGKGVQAYRLDWQTRDRIISALRSSTVNDELVEAAWRDFAENPPEAGERIIIVCDDGCSSSLALMTETGPIDGEDGWLLGSDFVRGAIWLALPVAYPLAFMERHDDY